MLRFYSVLVGILLILIAGAGCVCEKEEVIVSSPVPSGDGVPIAFTFTDPGGESAERPAIVFIHGWSCDRGYWEEQIPAVADQYQVVTLDLAGHGESGSDRTEWTLDALAGDVVAVADALNIRKMILVGHSLGGPVSLAAAARLSGRVHGIIGVDTLQDAEIIHAPEQINAFIDTFRADFTGACDRLVRSMFTASAGPELIDQVAGDMCATDPQVGIALFEMYAAIDSAAIFRDAGTAVRLINARAEPTNVEGNRRYAPDFDVVYMEDVGHFPMMVHPDEFNQHLTTWITDLEGKSADSKPAG